MTRFLVLSDICGLHVVGLPSCREEGPVQFAVTLQSKSRRTHGHISLSHLRLTQPGVPGPCIYIPQEQGGSVIPSGIGFHFCSLLRLAGLRLKYLTRLFAGHTLTSPKFKVKLTTGGHSASSFWCQAHFGAHDQILISLFDNYFISSSCRAPSLTRGRACNLQ
jgi:hypothetical protein